VNHRSVFKQGQMVKEGDVIAEIDPRPYQAALGPGRGEEGAGVSDSANARLDLARYTELAKQNFATRQQLDTQNARVSSPLESQIKGDEGAMTMRARRSEYTTIRAPYRAARPFASSTWATTCTLRHHRHRDDRAASADLGRADGARRGGRSH